jgi:hypothetical protein
MKKAVNTVRLTAAMKSQLLEHLREAEQSGVYWGPQEQFWKRHGKIVEWVESQETEGRGR